MIYFSIVHNMLNRLLQQKTMDIKLPVPIIDGKTMLSFLTLRKLHFKKHFIDSLLFHDHILKFHDFFST